MTRTNRTLCALAGAALVAGCGKKHDATQPLTRRPLQVDGVAISIELPDGISPNRATTGSAYLESGDGGVSVLLQHMSNTYLTGSEHLPPETLDSYTVTQLDREHEDLGRHLQPGSGFAVTTAAKDGRAIHAAVLKVKGDTIINCIASVHAPRGATLAAANRGYVEKICDSVAID